MQRLFLLLLPALILTLAACGGTMSTNGNPSASGATDRLLASGSGKPGGSTPESALAEPAPPNATQGLALEEVTYKPNTSGGLIVAGKIANRSASEVQATRVLVELLDESGKPLSSVSFAGPKLPTLKPGGTASWQGDTQFAASGAQRIVLTVDGVVVTAAP